MSERDGSKVTQILRDAILKLDLRPGAILDEADVAARLKVSRTPVREAIIQLVADGLVVREGRKAKVAPSDFDDVPKLYDALLISSRLVNRLAAENRTASDLKEIAKHKKTFEESVEGGNGLILSEANLQFHKAISAAAANKYIAAFYTQALVGTIRLARACFSSAHEFGEEPNSALRKHLAETVKQHNSIYDAIEARDVEAADTLAIMHYQLTKQRMITVLFSQSAALTDIPDMSLDTWAGWKAPVPG